LNGYFSLKNYARLHLKVFFHILNDALFAFQEFSNCYELCSLNYFANKVIFPGLTTAAKYQTLFLLFIVFNFYQLLIVLLSLELAF